MLPMVQGEEEFEQIYDMCDGILFTGGHDVNPALYNERKRESCGRVCEQRDKLERLLFEKVYADDKAAFGICRGIQFMNVMLGGTLYQDLPTEFTGSIKIEHHMKPPYTNICHKVTIEKDTPLFQILKIEELGVNSYHHQAVKTVGRDFIPMAYSQDGLVEAACCKEKKFIWAVQWHPEFNFQIEKTSRQLFDEFIKNCI